ncbi:hypothetical protein VCHC51A1_3009, partial [Vibrio cholerae HC-51A1]
MPACSHCCSVLAKE